MLISLNLARDQPLQQQLYDQLLTLIRSARLQAGARMPSTRMLAERLAISRITALLTYDRLISEGYLYTIPTKGTFVGREPCAGILKSVAQTAPSNATTHVDQSPSIRVGSPDPMLFPADRWRALTRNALDRFGAQLAREHASGHPKLRTAIAGWLSESRDLSVTADQIVLVNGRQQALHVIGHLLLHPGARAVVEDPCDSQAATAFVRAGASLVRVPVDPHGICTSLLPQDRIALAYVTPEHQRPLGVALTSQRRMALLDWTEQSGAVVVEEDCDGDLRCHGMDVPSMMSLDRSERVVLIGGFCSSLGPWLTLGYLVVPRRLIASALAARRLVDDAPRWLEETALAEFLIDGGYARHVRKVGKAYANRRDALCVALQRYFGDTAPTWGVGPGLHLTWFPPPGSGSPAALADLARRCGLEAAVPHVIDSCNESAMRAILLGFGSTAARQFESRVSRFAELLGFSGVSMNHHPP